jgi:hypothetical protein
MSHDLREDELQVPERIGASIDDIAEEHDDVLGDRELLKNPLGRFPIPVCVADEDDRTVFRESNEPWPPPEPVAEVIEKAIEIHGATIQCADSEHNSEAVRCVQRVFERSCGGR